jgi:hypothetical protein
VSEVLESGPSSWENPPFLMGKSTFSMAMFNRYITFIDDFPSYKPLFNRDFPWLC